MRLPLEIWREIYQYSFHLALESPTPIKDAHKLVGDTRQHARIMKDPEAAVPQNGLDASILRTCHQLYAELLPELYGNNCFHFQAPFDMIDFRSRGLSNELTEQPTFGLQPAPCGRLGLIKDVALQIGQKGSSLLSSRSMIRYDWQNFIVGRWGATEYGTEVKFPRVRTKRFSVGIDIRRLGSSFWEYHPSISIQTPLPNFETIQKNLRK